MSEYRCYCCEYAKYVDGSDIYCIKQNHFFNKFRIACDELKRGETE